MSTSLNPFAALSSSCDEDEDEGSGHILEEEPQVELEGRKDPSPTTKKAGGKRRKNKRGKETVTYDLGDFQRL